MDAIRRAWPTPTASDGTGGPGNSGRAGSPNLRTQIGALLNPTWVELLCGLPEHWTDRTVPNEALAPWPGWPAPQGPGQHAYEPPRTVPPRTVSDRASKLRALGNLCVSQQAYPVFAAIVAAEEEVTP